jgi:hypothetical protein
MMARVGFTADYDYKPTSQMTIGYQAGWTGTVKRDCAEKAVAANKAKLLNAKTATERVADDEDSESGKA